MIKKEFDSIELIDRNIAWSSDSEKNTHIALREDSSIFVVFSHGVFQTLCFQKNESFQIIDDCLVYDEHSVLEVDI